MRVITPSGREAIVVRILTGASKRDVFSRIICRFVGGTSRDLVTLQPGQLKPLYPKRAPAYFSL
jgi:hypothetical protein